MNWTFVLCQKVKSSYDLGDMSKGSRSQLEKVSTVHVRDNLSIKIRMILVDENSSNKISSSGSILKHTEKYVNE